MIGRLLKLLLLVLLAAVALSLGAWHWVLATDSGSQWLVNKARLSLVSPAVDFGSVSGNLRAGLRLRDLSVSLAAADIEVDELNLVLHPRLWPAAVVIPELAATGVRVHTPDSASAADTAALDLAGLQLPLPVTIRAASLRQLAWLDGGHGERLALDEVGFALDWHRELDIGYLHLRQGEQQLQASGRLVLDGQGSHRLELALPQWPQPLLRGVSLVLEGDLARSAVRVTADYPALQVDGFLADLSGVPVLDLNAALQAPLAGADDSGLLPAGYLLQALQLQLHGPAGAIGFTAGAQLDTPLFTGVELRGQGAFTTGDLMLQFSDFTVGLEDSTAQLSARGLVDLDQQRADVTLQWENLAWPPAALQGAPAMVSSPDGQLQLTGDWSAWQLSGRLALEAPDYPDGDVQLVASGDQHHADLAQVRLAALGGTAEGRARLEWGEAFKASGQLELAQVDLSAINARLPADVAGRLDFFHDAVAGVTDLQMQALTGRWMEQPLTAGGSLRLLPGDVVFDGIVVKAGVAGLELDGALRSPAGVRFALEADGDTWPGGVAGGQLAAQGRVLLHGEAPGLELELAARQLVVGDHRFAAVTASGTLADGIELAASGVNAFGLSMDQLSVSARQGADDSALSWRLQLGENRVSGALDGTALQLDEQWAPRWQGRLQALEWRSAERTLLSLVAPAEAQVTPAGWSLADACLAGFDGGELCLARFAQVGNGLSLEGEVREFPLGFVQELLQNDLQMTQELSGPFSFTQKAGALPSGNAQWRISPGRLRNPDLGNVLETSEGYIGFSLEQGQLRDGRIDLQLPKVGRIDLDLAIDGVAFDGTGRLDGHLHAEVFDAAPLGVLLPMVDGLQGRAVVELDVGGRSADPVLSGLVRINDGGVLLPGLGLRVWGLNLSGEVNQQDLLVMSGSARMGEGLAELRAQADFSDWWSPRLNLGVDGTDLLVANLPDISAMLSPQLQLQWADGAATLSGSARLHDTVVQPLAGFVTPIEESADVVIVGVLPGQTVTPARPRQALALFGTVDLLIGEQVRFESDLATASLGGELRLTWNGTLVPQAEGAITLNGQVSAFGPRLALEDSFLRFSGGSVTNPVLDLSATRNVFGNTQVRAAGVRIIGTANRPEVEAFTVPYTDQERAWALLITGSDLDYGQGIGGFDIGAYIAPRLYVSFGVSLFEEDTVVGVRYDLRRGFGVRATSGQRGSGIDATYTIDH